MSTQWYVYKNNQQKGPITREELSKQIIEGTVEPNDKVWTEGMAEWTAAENIEGLVPELEKSPPPPPREEIAPIPPPPPAGSAPVPPPPPGALDSRAAQTEPAAPPSSGPVIPNHSGKKKMSGLKLAGIIGGSLLVLIIILIVIALSSARSALRSSEVHEQAMAALQANPQAVSLLGEPVEVGKAVNGEINVNNGSGSAALSIPVSGSVSDGDLNTTGVRTSGQWSLTSLELVMANGEKLDLMAAQTGQGDISPGQSGFEAGIGSDEDDELPPRQAGGGSASTVPGMLTFNEPGYGFTMDYPDNWDYTIDDNIVDFRGPSGTVENDSSVKVQILISSRIGGTYSSIDDLYQELESLYSSLNGEVYEYESGVDYIGGSEYPYIVAAAMYEYEGEEYVEVVAIIERDTDYYYLYMYTVPLSAEEEFFDLVFDVMFESFEFVPF